MIHIPLILAVKATQVAYRNRQLIADSVRALQTDTTAHPADPRAPDTRPPSENDDASRSKGKSEAEMSADARAEHSANMQAMAASMKAWATKPRTW